MSYKATDYRFDKVTIPDTANGTNSRSFSVPRGAKNAVFFVPDLTGAGTLSLQVLTPQDSDQAAEAWVALSAVVYAAGATIGAMVMAGFADSTAYVLPVQGLGGATLRFVSTVAQGATPDAFTIPVVWGMDAGGGGYV